MADSRALRMDKEIFMKSKLSWVPIVTKPDSHYIGMPKRKNRDPQTTIDETLNEGEDVKGELAGDDQSRNEGDEKKPKSKTGGKGQTIEESTNGEAGSAKGTKRKKTT
jgi:hypothetical protein